jgi:hypothetical protein
VEALGDDIGQQSWLAEEQDRLVAWLKVRPDHRLLDVCLWIRRRAENSVAVSEITRLYARDKDDLEGLRRIVEVAALPDDWRDYFKY